MKMLRFTVFTTCCAIFVAGAPAPSPAQTPPPPLKIGLIMSFTGGTTWAPKQSAASVGAWMKTARRYRCRTQGGGDHPRRFGYRARGRAPSGSGTDRAGARRRSGRNEPHAQRDRGRASLHAGEEAVLYRELGHVERHEGPALHGALRVRHANDRAAAGAVCREELRQDGIFDLSELRAGHRCREVVRKKLHRRRRHDDRLRSDPREQQGIFGLHSARARREAGRLVRFPQRVGRRRAIAARHRAIGHHQERHQGDRDRRHRRRVHQPDDHEPAARFDHVVQLFAHARFARQPAIRGSLPRGAGRQRRAGLQRGFKSSTRCTQCMRSPRRCTATCPIPTR